MPPAAVCAACGARSTRGGRVRRLNELGFGLENERKAIHLCQDCLHRRTERQWTLEDDDGRRVYDALHGDPNGTRQRYSYFLEEDDRIHLLRLRPEWVDENAADT